MKVVPLGGCGEFGLNCTAYVCGEDSLLVDCGAQMSDETSPGVERFVPRWEGLQQMHPSGRIQALLLTHAHEDHIGATPHLLRTLNYPLPIYGSQLTLALLKRALQEVRVPRALWDLRPLSAETWTPIGAFAVQALPVEHSIPTSYSLMVRAEGRQVLHTGDLKIDRAPLPAIDGSVDLLLCDSTNATREGHSGSEEGVSTALGQLVEGAAGRVVVALFPSHVERMEHFAAACVRSGRRLLLLGRQLRETWKVARQHGFLQSPSSLLIGEDAAALLPARKLAVLCTGSQGEARAALARLAFGRQGPLRLEPGDTVVLAARTIPGCERPVGRIIDRLIMRGIEVRSGPAFCASGHGCREELTRLLTHVQPNAVLPVHGTARQLFALQALAQGLGLRVLRAHNGDVVEVGEETSVVGRIPIGRLAVEGCTVGEVGEETLRQRVLLGASGVVLVTGGRRRGVRVRAVGVADEGPALDDLCAAAARSGTAAVRGCLHDNLEPAERAVCLAVRRVFRGQRGVAPRVEVMLSEEG